ncbi:MAG: hypothetical protein ACREFY_19030, partial [Acetobacteraceae bacterium]
SERREIMARGFCHAVRARSNRVAGDGAARFAGRAAPPPIPVADAGRVGASPERGRGPSLANTAAAPEHHP